MYKLCKTEQSAQRQRQLEQGLLAAMLEKRYEDITVSELCDSMQIPRKAFYRYFTSKEGALFALLDHSMLDFYANGPRASDGGALGDLESFFLFWYNHRNLLEALERSHLGGMIIERATLLAQREKLMPRRILNWSEDLQGAAMSFSVSGLMAMVFHWHQQGYKTSPEEITRVAIAMLTSPLVQVSRSAQHTREG